MKNENKILQEQVERFKTRPRQAPEAFMQNPMNPSMLNPRSRSPNHNMGNNFYPQRDVRLIVIL